MWGSPSPSRSPGSPAPGARWPPIPVSDSAVAGPLHAGSGPASPMQPHSVRARNREQWQNTEPLEKEKTNLSTLRHPTDHAITIPRFPPNCRQRRGSADSSNCHSCERLDLAASTPNYLPMNIIMSSQQQMWCYVLWSERPSPSLDAGNTRSNRESVTAT